MKFVPTAFTCTPVRATSIATFLASIVAPARAAEYSGASGGGRAADALVMTSTWPSRLLDHRRHDGTQEPVRAPRGTRGPRRRGPPGWTRRTGR